MKKTLTAAALALGFTAYPLLAQNAPQQPMVQTEHHEAMEEHHTQTTTRVTPAAPVHHTTKHVKKHVKKHRGHVKKVVTTTHTHVEEHH